jgi:predicted RND superfamily exporter protein
VSNIFAQNVKKDYVCNNKTKQYMDRELEQLRKQWGIEKLISPFVTKREVDEFWEKRKEIEELELKIKKLKSKHYEKNRISRDSR